MCAVFMSTGLEIFRRQETIAEHREADKEYGKGDQNALPGEQIADSGNGFAVQSGNDVPWSDPAPCALGSNQTGALCR